MIYTTPWEPGFDTHKILAKKMAVWLDLLNVDPMMEVVGKSLLGSLGDVLQVAGTTEKMERKFANIQGCVLMDMTQPLPSVLSLHMNKVSKKIRILYDKLPNACFKCHERGHFAQICPRNQPENQKEVSVPEQEAEDPFTEVKGRGKGKLPVPPQPIPERSNAFEVLNEAPEETLEEGEVEMLPVAGEKEKGAENNEKEVDVDNMTEEEESLNNFTQQDTCHQNNNSQLKAGIPDLNATPIDPPSKKKNKKARQREKRREDKLRKEAAHGAETQVPLDQAGDLQIATWNVNGLGGADRLRAAKSWLQNNGRGTKILVIQELKTPECQVEFNLRTLMPGATVVVDYATNELGGAAMVIHAPLLPAR
ncbi:hypothetical protein R1sor_013895 [Riccia sorocarpa]|uniref:CCHC-type domain-containing protein n=1 Tax=Riccia sorocarpa TaxID=122646 RepID=A0ABD3H9S6_9MARC